MARRKLDRRIEVSVAFVVFAALVIFLASYLSTESFSAHQTSNSFSSNESGTSLPMLRNVSYLKAPAVDSQGDGVVTTLEVDSVPGSGRTLVDIQNLIFFTDTQSSIQTAKSVAEQASGIDTSNLDLIYSINTSAQLIEGPSAGAALTIDTIAALENKTLNSSVMITGTINSDGTIGQVGGILAKAEAAKASGATLFLVPDGQATQTTYEPQTTCQTEGQFNVCQTQYQSVTTNISSTVGIPVMEVGTIQEALKYFLS